MSESRGTLPSARAAINKARRLGNFKTCLHPHASSETCGKFISAHTLQRSRVLRAIESPDHHVLTFFPFEWIGGTELRIHRRGWRQASVFDAFCDKHDSSTFENLEKTSFVGSKEQIFLIGYRATCWELYRKASAIRANPILMELVPENSSESARIRARSALAIHLADNQKGLDDARGTKSRMDAAYLGRDYSKYCAYRIDLASIFPIAATGGITPNRTISGKNIQAMSDPAELQWLLFGIDLNAGKSSIVFLWEAGHDAPRKYMEEIDDLSDADTMNFISQFVFAHCENIYFSETWWKSLACAKKDSVQRLAQIVDPYFYPPDYNLHRALTSCRLVFKGHV